MNMLGYGLIHLIELKPLSLRPLNIDSHYGSKITMASSLTLSILLPKKKKKNPWFKPISEARVSFLILTVVILHSNKLKFQQIFLFKKFT